MAKGKPTYFYIDNVMMIIFFFHNIGLYARVFGWLVAKCNVTLDQKASLWSFFKQLDIQISGSLARSFHW